MSKHTPGPYWVERGPFGYIIMGHFYSDRGREPKRVRLADMPEDELDEQTLATSRLLAAAPELLEACKAIVGGDDMPKAGEPGHIDFGQAIALARAAIAKAEGEAERAS